MALRSNEYDINIQKYRPVFPFFRLGGSEAVLSSTNWSNLASTEGSVTK